MADREELTPDQRDMLLWMDAGGESAAPLPAGARRDSALDDLVHLGLLQRHSGAWTGRYSDRYSVTRAGRAALEEPLDSFPPVPMTTGSVVVAAVLALILIAMVAGFWLLFIALLSWAAETLPTPGIFGVLASLSI